MKGRVQTRNVEKDDKPTSIIEMVAEKITFLSNKKAEAD